MELRRESEGKESKDAALAKVVKDESQREIFRGIMHEVAKKQSAEMSDVQRRQRATKAAQTRWKNEQNRKARDD